MALKRRRPPEIDFNVGAFSDIAFLLIIFFILTTTFVLSKGGQLHVPSGTTDPKSKQKTQPTVHLSAGAIRWGDRKAPLSLDELKDVLAAQAFAAQPAEKRVVILNSAPDVEYQLYFEVVMAIDQADGVLALVEREDAGGSAAP